MPELQASLEAAQSWKEELTVSGPQSILTKHVLVVDLAHLATENIRWKNQTYWGLVHHLVMM